jgi:hypothetical protein
VVQCWLTQFQELDEETLPIRRTELPTAAVQCSAVMGGWFTLGRQMKFCEKHEVDMLKIILIITDYTLIIFTLPISQYYNT